MAASLLDVRWPWSEKNGQRRRLQAPRLDSVAEEVEGDEAELSPHFDLLGEVPSGGDAWETVTVRRRPSS